MCWDTEDRLHKPCISHYHSCCLSKKQSPKLQECEDTCIWNRSGAFVNCVWGVLLSRHCFCYLRVDWKKVILALPKKWSTNFSTFPISHLVYILVFARFYFLIMMWISHTFYVKRNRNFELRNSEQSTRNRSFEGPLRQRLSYNSINICTCRCWKVVVIEVILVWLHS